MMATTLSRDSSASPPPAKTIDELTTALSTFSRMHTPDPQVICCCGRDTCETTKAWAAMRSKLESRLVLSAEVGQALLERHEAYVRRQDVASSRPSSSVFSLEYETSSSQQAESLRKRLDEVMEENNLMEARINELMIKNEMTDASNRTIIRELQESRATIGRLTAQNARSAGWEMRLSQLTQERDDMRQERDSETHRARIADSKAAAFVDKCSRLQNEIYALQEEVKQYRSSRAEFSKNVLQEARSRLESLQHSLGHARVHEDPESMIVFESLVADNETLKRDIAELQNLLVESREDVRALREELEEHRASVPFVIDDITKVGTPPPLLSSSLYNPRSPAKGRKRGHHPTNSAGSAASLSNGSPLDPKILSSSPRPPATRMQDYQYSSRWNLSGDDAIMGWRHEQEDDETLTLPNELLLPPPQTINLSPPHIGESSHGSPSPHVKSPLLPTRSRGVQTDTVVPYGYPSPRPSTLGVDKDSPPSTPAPEGHSDTSSISQQDLRTVPALLERLTTLLARMLQADVRTLMNRLKRQHLASGDVGHLSRTTIRGILNEAAALRVHMGNSGSDDALIITRGDCKTLLKFAKDAFAELGALRERFNEVILDPTIAQRLSSQTLQPEKVKSQSRPSSSKGGGGGGWIAPIQKFFTQQPALPDAPVGGFETLGVASTHPADVGGRGRARSRVAPKLAPEISATSTTVNVEFASSGVRKIDVSEDVPRQHRVPSTTMTAATAMASGLNPPPPSHVIGPTVLRQPTPVSSSSRQLMGIFAGAPQSFTNNSPERGSWVVLPTTTTRGKDRVRQLKSAASNARLGGRSVPEGAGVGVAGGRASAAAARNNSANRLSRNVDAVIDQNDGDLPDFRDTLQRTLRPRGLSDSSIHTSFLKGGEAASSSAEEQQQQQNLADSSAERTPVVSSPSDGPPPSVLSPTTPPQSSPPSRQQQYNGGRARSPPAKIVRNLASWATAAAGGLTDMDGLQHELLIGSPPREEALLHHAAWSRRGVERDF